MYWKGYSWSLLGGFLVATMIGLSRSWPDHISWVTGLVLLLWVFGILGLFGFSYGFTYLSPPVRKFIFWSSLIWLGASSWLCTFPETWNARNLALFIGNETLWVLMLGPFYLALYWYAYPSQNSAGINNPARAI